jgi:glycogen debranching enzyme
MPPTSTAAAASRLAVEVLNTNRRNGRCAEGGYDFTCPSPRTYPFQWAWDSSFHAIALTHLDPDRAAAELSSLTRGIDEAGFLPHMLLWQPELRERAAVDFRIAVYQGWKSITLAPPVLARAIERVFASTGDRQWLREVLPPVCRHFDWLERTRSTHDGLLRIFQPDESGLDMSPKYDEALGLNGSGDIAAEWHASMRSLLDDYRPSRRPSSTFTRFQWADLVFNTIYADGLRCLTRLLRHAAIDSGQRYEDRYVHFGRALLRHCWDDDVGVFRDLDLAAGAPSRVITISAIFPVILDVVPDAMADRVIDEHLLNPAEFWLPYPLPSVAAIEASFDPDFRTAAIFRGSTWVNLNWYLYWGLRDRGRSEIARVLAQRTITMVACAGLRECYGPRDGSGHGAEEFGWSSLVLDLINAEETA